MIFLSRDMKNPNLDFVLIWKNCLRSFFPFTQYRKLWKIRDRSQIIKSIPNTWVYRLLQYQPKLLNSLNDLQQKLSSSQVEKIDWKVCVVQNRVKQDLLHFSNLAIYRLHYLVLHCIGTKAKVIWKLNWCKRVMRLWRKPTIFVSSIRH